MTVRAGQEGPSLAGWLIVPCFLFVACGTRTDPPPDSAQAETMVHNTGLRHD